MKLDIKSVMGVDRAVVTFDKGQIVLFAGKNGQGKSSILNAASLALLAEPFPPGCTKTAFGEQMVNDGAACGYVIFDSGKCARQITYPTGEMKTLHGSSIQCDEISLQRKSLHDYSLQDRAKMLTEITKTGVTRKRIEEEFASLNLDKDKAKKIIDMALANGFEVASKQAKEYATELKGQFKFATNTGWGSDKGVSWQPEGYTADLASISIDQLKADVEHASRAYNEAMQKAAVYRAAGDKDAHAKEVMEWTAKLEGYDGALKLAENGLKTAQLVNEVVECSNCGFVGTVDSGKLAASSHQHIMTTDEHEALTRTYKTSKAASDNARVALGMAKQKFDTADGAGEPVDVEPFKQAHATAVLRLSAATTKAKSLHLHYQIVDMLKGAEIISPAGLPMRALLEGIKVLNKELVELCELAEWNVVEIDRDLNLRYDGRLYHDYVCSESERLRCDVTFQVLWARKKRSEVVVIDRVDLLDGEGRNGLFSLLANTDMTALVAMMILEEGEEPDLKKTEIGKTLIVEGGRALEVMLTA